MGAAIKQLRFEVARWNVTGVAPDHTLLQALVEAIFALDGRLDALEDLFSTKPKEYPWPVAPNILLPKCDDETPNE
jgi:hypothetical protein